MHVTNNVRVVDKPLSSSTCQYVVAKLKDINLHEIKLCETYHKFDINVPSHIIHVKNFTCMNKTFYILQHEIHVKISREFHVIMPSHEIHV